MYFFLKAHRNRPRISITIATSIIPPRRQDTSTTAARIRIASDRVRIVETMVTNRRSRGVKDVKQMAVVTGAHTHTQTVTDTTNPHTHTHRQIYNHRAGEAQYTLTVG